LAFVDLFLSLKLTNNDLGFIAISKILAISAGFSIPRLLKKADPSLYAGLTPPERAA
jgi:hypothetical protein